jgi:ribosomal protein S18 acetylase RimI-like enzyme
MSEKHLENSKDEEIIETQEESEEDDEVTFRFFVNGNLVSWAKSLLYCYLEEIHTAIGEKRKGYGRKLLSHIEKIAKVHGASAMKTCYYDSCNDEAASFFRSMGYGLKQVENDTSRFLEATKRL